MANENKNYYIGGGILLLLIIILTIIFVRKKRKAKISAALVAAAATTPQATTNAHGADATTVGTTANGVAISIDPSTGATTGTPVFAPAGTTTTVPPPPLSAAATASAVQAATTALGTQVNSSSNVSPAAAQVIAQQIQQAATQPVNSYGSVANQLNTYTSDGKVIDFISTTGVPFPGGGPSKPVSGTYAQYKAAGGFITGYISPGTAAYIMKALGDQQRREHGM